MKFEQLKKEFKLEVEAIEAPLRNFPWEDKTAYANWCAQTYYYVCHSTRLLALSAALIPLEQDSIYSRYLKHIQEEAGHEKMALGDLRKLGHVTGDFPELAVTSAFYQTQYYFIEHVNVFSLFGYILILEGLSAEFGKDCYARALAAHGAKATNFWRVHAEEDPGHVDQAFSHLEELSEKDFHAIARNLRDSRTRYGELLDTVARTQSISRRKIA